MICSDAKGHDGKEWAIHDSDANIRYILADIA
jgi:hypothetical protein